LRLKILIILSLAFLHFNATAQVSYKLDVQNESLKSCFEQISNKYDVVFAYDADLLSEIRVSKTIKTGSIPNLIEQLLSDNKFDYKLVRNVYLIYFNSEKVIKIQIVKSKNGTKPKTKTIHIKKDTLNNEIDTIKKRERIKETPVKPIKKSINLKLYWKKNNQLINDIPFSNSSLIAKNQFTQLRKVVKIDEYNEINHLGLSDPLYQIGFTPRVSISNYNQKGINLNNIYTQNPLIYFNNIPIYEPANIFGKASVLNSNMLAYKSSFSSEVNNSLNFFTPYSNTGKFISLKINQNNLSSDIYSTINIKNRVEIKFSGRRSYNDLINNVFYNELFNTVKQHDNYFFYRINNRKYFIIDSSDVSNIFYDIAGNVKIILNKHHFNISAISSQNQFSVIENENSSYYYYESKQINTNKNDGMSFQLKSFWNKKIESEVNFSYANSFNYYKKTHSTSINSEDIVETVFKDANIIENYETSINAQYYISSNNTLLCDLGLISTKTSSINTADANHLKEIQLSKYYISAYHFYKKNNHKLTYGGQLDIIDNISYSKPFISYSLSLNKSEISVSFKRTYDLINKHVITGSNSDNYINWKLNRQPLNKGYTVNLRNKLKVTDYIDLITGINTGWYSSVSTYLYNQNQQFQIDLINVENGRSRLFSPYIETQVNSESIQSSLSYIYSNLQFQFSEINNDQYFNIQNRPKHQVKFENRIQLNGFGFIANGVIAGGRYYFTPMGKHYILSNNNTYSDLHEGDNFYQSKIPMYKRIDLGIDYSKKIKKTELSISLMVHNVFNFQNTEDIIYSPVDYINTNGDETIPVYRSQKINSLPVYPSVKIMLNF